MSRAPLFVVMFRRGRFGAWRNGGTYNTEARARAALEDIRKQLVPDPLDHDVKQPRHWEAALYECIEPARHRTLTERRRRRRRMLAEEAERGQGVTALG